MSKLFNIIQPDRAVFGQKDFQQLKVIQRLVRDLCYPIEIVPVSTVREPDGLALSSRNRYLSATNRAQATVLYRGLTAAREQFKNGERDANRLEAALRLAIQPAPAARLDYAAIADVDTLEPVHEVQPGHVALLAVHFGQTRLIDNLIL